VSNALVFLVEDEKAVRNFIRAAVTSQKYRYLDAATGEEAMSLAASHMPDIVLLDLGLPDLDGMDVIRRIREFSTVPILVLSARGREDDKVAALDLGADDYLVKPFGTGELLARIRAALRHSAFIKRSAAGGFTAYRLGDLEIDLVKRRVSRGAEEVRVTPTEFKLLSAMARHPGKVLTHAFLVKEIWGPLAGDDTQSLRVHMASLRRKLERDPSSPLVFRTEVGVGYRMAEDSMEGYGDD
jgi:two-component system, OmpR family, KDP operon response regulator KdpE